MSNYLKNFNAFCNLILESFSNNPFNSLNPNDFPKAHKYNDFPEGDDIDITDKFKNYKS